MIRLFLLLLCLMMWLSCSTTRKVETIPVEAVHAVTNRDTIYLHDLCYDSVCIDRSSEIDRTHDTIRITTTNTVYRYKWKRDTIRIIQMVERHDSIPYEVVVTEIKEVRAPPTWFDKAAYASLFLLLLFATIRVRKLF